MATTDPRVDRMEGILERIAVEQSEIRRDLRQLVVNIQESETRLRSEMQESETRLRSEMQESETRLRSEMQKSETRLHSEMRDVETRLRAEMGAMQTRMTQMWISIIGTMMAGFIAIIIAFFLK